MACSIQEQQSPSELPSAITTPTLGHSFMKSRPNGPRGSLPTDPNQPALDFQWPSSMPVSMHTSNLRLTMMNQDPKDLHTARLIIEELRTKVRYQTEHILKWRKAYALQIQQHYRYQKEKSDQMNALTSQLLLLESRLKRKQKQISSLLNHRELTIQRQQKIIDALSNRLLDHGLDTSEVVMSFTTELDTLNDSDSAVVLDDIDSDSNMTLLGARRKSSGGVVGTMGSCLGADGITIVRSISDAIETNLNKYGSARRNNCYLRRPEILETVYSVEEDPEPTSDVAEKRDKFKNRSEKILSSSSIEGQIDYNTLPATGKGLQGKAKESNIATTYYSMNRCSSNTQESPPKDGYTAVTVIVPQLHAHNLTHTYHKNHNNSSNSGVLVAVKPAANNAESKNSTELVAKSQVTNYNRVMSNHRSVTKPKDVKYKRINKAKSKSLEELRGRLKNLVERGNTVDSVLSIAETGYRHGIMPQTAQFYA